MRHYKPFIGIWLLSLSLEASYVFQKLPSMTQESFLVCEEGRDEYVRRAPLKMRLPWIDLAFYEKNSREAFEKGFNPVSPSIDGEGFESTLYLEDFSTFRLEEFYREEGMNKIASLLKKIHTSSMPFTNEINVFDRIDRMEESLTQEGILFPEVYVSSKEGIDSLREIMKNLILDKVPTHGEIIPSNLLILKDQLMLFHWEYSGLNDPAWDLAYLSSQMNYSCAFDEALIQTYQGRQDHELKKKMALFKPIIEHQIGLWALWAYKMAPTPGEREFFRYLAISHFHKSLRYHQDMFPLTRYTHFDKDRDHYLYDQEGEALFVKIYKDQIGDEKGLCVSFPLLADEEGLFFALPIQCEQWICPCCGMLNPVQRTYCLGKNCILNGERD